MTGTFDFRGNLIKTALLPALYVEERKVYYETTDILGQGFIADVRQAVVVRYSN